MVDAGKEKVSGQKAKEWKPKHLSWLSNPTLLLKKHSRVVSRPLKNAGVTKFQQSQKYAELATMSSDGITSADLGMSKHSKKNTYGQVMLKQSRRTRNNKLKSVLQLSPDKGGNVVLSSVETANVDELVDISISDGPVWSNTPDQPSNKSDEPGMDES